MIVSILCFIYRFSGIFYNQTYACHQQSRPGEFGIRFLELLVKLINQYKHRYFCRNEKENTFIGRNTYKARY